MFVERVVHARGAGAHGYFKVFDDSAKKYTSAPVLTDASRTTPTFVRFSTVQGSKGSAVSIKALFAVDDRQLILRKGYRPRRPRIRGQTLHR